jgi:hypothetical protein
MMMHPRSRRYTRLHLEVLEDRAVPAALVATTTTTPDLLQTDVEAQISLARRFAESSSTAPDGLGVITLAELVAVSAEPLPQSVEITAVPGLVGQSSSSSVVQAQAATASPSAVPLSSPATGAQALFASWAGPFTSTFGQFQVGGGDSSSEDSGAPALPAPGPGLGGGEADGGAPDGHVPDDVWLGIDWLEQQATVLRG